ncbi:MAG: hypothetical protein JO247_16330, partial [Chloroflexi bacterium]|nr:hypothetical protein [Chloroflexota bacterium]
DPNSAELATVYDSLMEALAKDPTPEVAGAETIVKAMQSMDPSRYGKLSAADIIDASYMQRIKASSG